MLEKMSKFLISQQKISLTLFSGAAKPVLIGGYIAVAILAEAGDPCGSFVITKGAGGLAILDVEGSSNLLGKIIGRVMVVDVLGCC